MRNLYAIAFLIILSFSAPVNAQVHPDVKLGDEYFLKGDFEKAQESYENAFKKRVLVENFYENYRQTLNELQEYKTADKFYKKLLKTQPSNIIYQIDYAILRDDQGKQSEAEKMFSKTIQMSKHHTQNTLLCASHFLKRGYTNQAIETYLKARSSGNRYDWARELAEVYMKSGKHEYMIDELLNLLAASDDNLEEVQNFLQANLQSDDYNILEQKLFSKIQGQTGKLIYNKLLVWYYVQKKDFYSAYIQAKAIDTRSGTPERKGETLYELGKIARENHDYSNAVLCFQHISDKFHNSYLYYTAKRLLIETKEDLVKTKYPIPDEDILKLIEDYKDLKQRVRNSEEIILITRNIARLYSFYLSDHAKAKQILNEVLNKSRISPNLEAECKILLGDIFLLENEPWESTLLYSQAEKKVKDSPVAHQAKLKNAQLSFYRGDFELAQAHLDVLKLATSREISNDAIDLSLLISDNLNLDTSAAAMTEYAAIDLLLFQHQYEEAQRRLDQMLTHYPGHSLTDEIYWQKAQIFQKTADAVNAVKYLEKILKEFPEDILGDNALFTLAEIYHYKLKDDKKAMDYYKQLLMDYPGSIYTAESRKRFRQLRGDAVFKESSESGHPHIH